MRFYLPAAALATVLTTGVSVDAVAGYPDPAMMGVGIVSCAAWTASRSFQWAGMHEQWILGFLSGIGYANPNGSDPLNKVDSSGVWAWVDNYCQANPTKGVVDAGIAFARENPR